jgi:hypothetical protein
VRIIFNQTCEVTCIAVMLSISFESSSVCMRFAESNILGLLHFFMQKYAVRDDCTSASLCMLVSRVKYMLICRS